MRNKGIIVCLISIGLALGFVQERFKIAVNYLLEFSDSNPTYFQLSAHERKSVIEQSKTLRAGDYFFNHRTPSRFYSLERPQLVRFKWTLAAAGAAAFSGLNLLVIWLLFRSKQYLKLAGLFLAGLAVGSFSLFAIGTLLQLGPGWYAVARELLGGVQSLVPLMVLVPAFWLASHSSANFEAP